MCIEEKLFPIYSTEVQKKMEEAIETLNKAYIYAHCTDWFLSGDDSEETFLKKLGEKLNHLKKTKKSGITKEKFIKKWLGNKDYEFNEKNKDLMKEDLDLVKKRYTAQ